jgi:hypothetical protein
VFGCPNCWHTFFPEEVLSIAKHPDLIGDPVVGENEYRRFLPTRFNIQGEAIDPKDFPTLDIACPRCHLQIAEPLLEVPQLFVSLLGLPASGKTYLLTAMTWELRRLMPQAQISFSDADPASNTVIHEYEHTLFLNPTPDGLTEIRKTQTDDPHLYRTAIINAAPVRYPIPLQFRMWPMPSHPGFRDASRIGRVVVLYDNAGEDYLPKGEESGSATVQHMAKSQILFFLFDPTQDPRFRSQCKAEDPQIRFGSRPNTSTTDVVIRQETVLRAAAVRIRRYAGLSQDTQLRKPLFIIVPKWDIWRDVADITIDKEPYVEAENGLMGVDVKRIEETSEILRRLFTKLCPEFVATAESLSALVRYIPVSSLGRSPVRVTKGEKTFYGIRPKEITPKWVTVPLLYSLCAWAPGLMAAATGSAGKGGN